MHITSQDRAQTQNNIRALTDSRPTDAVRYVSAMPKGGPNNTKHLPILIFAPKKGPCPVGENMNVASLCHDGRLGTVALKEPFRLNWLESERKANTILVNLAPSLASKIAPLQSSTQTLSNLLLWSEHFREKPPSPCVWCSIRGANWYQVS